MHTFVTADMCLAVRMLTQTRLYSYLTASAFVSYTLTVLLHTKLHIPCYKSSLVITTKFRILQEIHYKSRIIFESSLYTALSC
jgi:hypothetical protein